MYTAETIIIRFNEIHGGKYDYSSMNYVKTTEKISIICPIHGVFMQTPQAHLKGQGCPHCGKKKKSISKTYTNNEFIERAKIIHNNKYDYSKVKYINNKKKVCIICPIHGEFFIEPNAHIQGRGCIVCGNLKKGRRINPFKKEIFNYIKKYNNDIILNYTIENELIDLYIPSFNVGFMFVDLLSYSEKKLENKKILLHKTKICEKNNIQLIHIFEDEWKNKKEICISRIENILGLSKRIYARDCKIVSIDKNNAKGFFTNNHIQGNVNSKYVYGLEYNGEIVSMMSFGGLRKNMGRKSEENEYELLRFCNKIGYSVIGGASRLFKYFKTTNTPLTVISYADRRWSMGNMYNKLGFTFVHNSEPSYFYLVNGERKNRFSYRKDILISKYGCRRNDTEHNFCNNNGWYRIYDCGTMLFEWKQK